MSCLQAGPRPLEVGEEIYFARMFFQEHVLRVDAEQRVAGGGNYCEIKCSETLIINCQFGQK